MESGKWKVEIKSVINVINSVNFEPTMSTNDQDQVLSSKQLLKLSKEEIVEYHLRTSTLTATIAELNCTVKEMASRLEKTESELVVVKNVCMHGNLGNT